jgi:HAD superfamily hydrolase (TIGR01509 family)
MTFKGFIFDVDGVLVDSPHELAWGETLRQLMETEWLDVARARSWRPEAYTSEVYQHCISGRLRAEGARTLLCNFGIPDRDGRRAKRLCELKQAMVVELIAAGRFRAFPDALRLLTAAKAAGGRLAAASSSMNAGAMLGAVRPDEVLGSKPGGPSLLGLFDVDVCGRNFNPGKPDPAIFLAAIAELRLQARECIVIEDAPAGVRAAKAAQAACLGIARLDNVKSLRGAGADWVVPSLDDVSVKQIPTGVELVVVQDA